MTQPAQLPQALLAVLDRVTVSEDGCRATVGDRSILAASPAELTHRLSHAIYELFHVGWPAEPDDKSRADQDDRLAAELLAATPHRSVRRAAPLVSADGEHVTVELDGVTVAIPRDDAELAAGQRDGQVTVRLPSYRPTLSPGYWLAEGTRPLAKSRSVLRVYVHLRTAAAIVPAWRTVLCLLEDRGVGYRAKVTSNAAQLPRRDGLVVYLGGGALDSAAALAERTSGIAGIGTAVSAFAEQIGPGIAIASEPADTRPAMRGLSFGEHRARAVADGLVQHAVHRSGGSAPGAVTLALIAAGIDPACTARNLDR